ncbi:polyphosphate kinase 2 family protein [Mycolicibacterium pallens]|uniref:Polyphosphate kinase 2 family protein n=1 Tax=Mycolicibacterium pallens TaxID=370524 RepID=A0ABX8VHI7_9MYCO|nr:polyphosphate kinase 2 family protein [Mycolicibacterium pallens]
MSPQWEHLAAGTLVAPGTVVNLAKDFDPGLRDRHIRKDEHDAALLDAKRVLMDLQDKFLASADRALLIILQAIDAAGKDSTIKHVMSGLNPEGVHVYNFTAPSAHERAHDYLWRHQRVLPELGRIAVFNRSHYENVLITRVHPETLWPQSAVPQEDNIWHNRFRSINAWERHLTDNGTTIIKLFLNLSRAEQSRRFLARIQNPEKNWKFSVADLQERAFWDDYQVAFEEMLTHTSTRWAPWYVIPSDRKWFGHLCTSAVLVNVLRGLNPHYPAVDPRTKAQLAHAEQQLLDGN